MNTKYLLDVFTLKKSEAMSQIIAVMESTQAAGTHVSYADYISVDHELLESKALKFRKGRHFA